MSGSRILRFSDVPGPQSYPIIGTRAGNMFDSKFARCAFMNVSLSLIGEELLEKKDLLNRKRTRLPGSWSGQGPKPVSQDLGPLAGLHIDNLAKKISTTT